MDLFNQLESLGAKKIQAFNEIELSFLLDIVFFNKNCSIEVWFCELSNIFILIRY